MDCALGLLKLEAHTKKVDTGRVCFEYSEYKLAHVCKFSHFSFLLSLSPVDNMIRVGDVDAFERETESLELLLEGNPDGNIRKNSSEISVHCDKDSEDIRPEVMDGIRLSDSVIPFEEVKSIMDFNILANGLIINSELPKYLQGKYYDLCCSQNAFLHEHLIDGLNCKLVAGIISETINIADAIRASNITTPVDDFATWDRTLTAFEGLGMKVGFLRARLDGLIDIASESKSYKNVRVERDNAKEELGVLVAKLSAVKEKMTRLNTDIEALGVNFHTFELKFKKVATAPW